MNGKEARDQDAGSLVQGCSQVSHVVDGNHVSFKVSEGNKAHLLTTCTEEAI